jgi:GNAT superfamily N-acetyltransferase
MSAAVHELNILKVTRESQISDFLSACAHELTTFRYFATRPISVFNNHAFTYVVYMNNTPIAYYHLDNDETTLWFGVCVLANYQNSGIGQLCLTHLKSMCRIHSIFDVNLSVDSSNTKAISLYLKNGFEITKVVDSTLYMTLKKSN